MGKRKTKRQRRLERRLNRQYHPVDSQGRLKPHCETIPTLTWQRFKNGEMHCRVTCVVCGKFLGYAPRFMGLEVLESIPITPSKESIGPLYKPSQDQGVPWE